jgi:hypothetical protein
MGVSAMDGEIEFLGQLGEHLRRVAAEQRAKRASQSTRLLRLPRIRALSTMAVAVALLLVGLTLWATIPAREGIRTQPAPGDGQEPGPGGGGALPPPTGEQLWAVDAASADDVWAVGSRYEGESFRDRSLILHLDGETWSRVPVPDVGMLTDVAVASPDAAWAISGKQILRWDGLSWQTSPDPAPPGAVFSSVDASGPGDAWVVGMRHGAHWVDEYGENNVGWDTLAMHWDGTAWTIVPSPNAAPRNNNVEGVLALSPTDAWVVGYSQEGNHPRTLTMHWDGATWSLVPSPDPGRDFNVLWGMGTDGDGGVWAVGHYGDPGSRFMALYLRWTGSEWEIVAGPSGEALHQTPTALSGSSADDAWAVGSEPTSSFLIAHWDGSTWSSIEAEIPVEGSDSPSLSDVAALSPTDAWAVGRYQGPRRKGGSAEIFPLIQHWDGGSWDVVEAPESDG